MSLNETRLYKQASPTSSISTDGKTLWRGTEESTGIHSANPTMRGLGECALKLQDEAAQLTEIRPNDPVAANEWASARFKKSAIGANEALLVADSKGQLLQLASQSDNGPKFDTIGNYDPNLRAALDQIRLESGGLDGMHLQYLDQLLKLPERGVIVELGAGSYYERIRALNTCALQQRGHLICHDPTPAAVIAAREEVPEIPYWALPPVTQFLGGALAETNAPVVMTSRNVLTSMSYERTTDLLAVCRDVRPRRLVMTLSLQFNSSNPSVPYEYQVSSQRPGELIINQTIKHLQNRRVVPLFSDQISLSIAVNQAYMSFYHAIAEVAARDFFHRARAEGIFSKGQAVVVEMHRDLDLNSAREFIQIHPLGRVISSLQQVLFNTVLTGPFGFSLANLPGVPDKHLRVMQPQVHLIFGNDLKEEYEIKNAKVEIFSLDKQQSFTLSQYRFQHPAIMLSMLGAQTQDISEILNKHGIGIRSLQEAGAAAAIEHCFSMRDAGNGWVQSDIIQALKPYLMRELAS